MPGSAAEGFVRGWGPGLIGENVALQARVYAAEWGFNAGFEIAMAAGLAEFMTRYDPARDLLLSAWSRGRLDGTIAIDGSDPALPAGQAHLRWFVVHGAMRGTGIGRRLLADALAFADAAGAATVYLDTFEGLDRARRLYERAGFALVSEGATVRWGQQVRHQRFERHRP